MNERREASRRRVYYGARIVPGCRLSDTECLVRDLSAGGARVVVSGVVPLPRRFDLAIACRGETLAVESVWRAGDEIGIRFLADAGRDDLTPLREELRASRAEVAELRERLAASELRARPADGPLH